MRVTNPRRTPLASRTIEEHVGGRPLRLDVPPLGPGRSTEAVYALPTARRGVVTVGPALIVKTDLLGLMRREIAQTDVHQLWVHPRVAALGPLPVGFAKDLEGPTSDASPAGDVAFHALREYEPGDDHRHIHWMSTARSGTLMVRHHVDNRRPNVTVVVDTEIASYRSERQFDLAIEVAASIGVSSLLNGQPVAVWLDRDVVTGQNRPAGRTDVLDRLTLATGTTGHRRRRRRPARAAGRVRDLRARRGHRRRAHRSLPGDGVGRPPHGADHPRADVAAGRPAARRPAGSQGGRRRRSRRVPGRVVAHHVEGDVVTPRRRIPPYVTVSVTIVAVMSVIAAAGFRSALSGWGFVTAAAIGAIGAAGIVMVASWRRLLLGESVALSALGFVVLGGVAVGGVPTPGAYGDFAAGLLDGWADLLSSAPPADITPQLRALPFTVAWLSAAIGGELARNSRRPGLPAIGPLLALALSLLFTIEERWLALAQGAGILAGTLLLIIVGQRLGPRRVTATLDEFDAGAVATNRGRLMLGAAVVVGAVVAAPVVGPHLPGAESNERFDLRRYQVPPFDPLAVPSPLAEVKASLKDDRKDDVVFTVTGDTPITRFPVAVMTDYDGVVWTVADPERDPAATEFVPVDTHLPELADAVPGGSTEVTQTIEVRDLGGSFLPTAGVARQLDLAGDTDLDPRLNLQTGTLALPGGVPEGLTYTVRSALPLTVTESQLADATITPIDRSDELELLPPNVLRLAADLTEGYDAGWGKLAAIRDEFVQRGFYDATADTPPGHSYGRIGTMLTDPARIVGFEEQYAAAAAVMAQVAELPVRVVVGYEVSPDAWRNGTVDVTANDISAWVELDAGELGWVPVDVTPDRSRIPDPEAQGATTQQVAVPNPPPPPPPPPDVEPPRQEERRIEETEIDPITHTFGGETGWAPWTMVAVGVAAVPIALLALFAAVVIGWKALRRRQRRTRPSTTGRIAGAWAEAIDRCTEAGAPRLDGVTPRERVGVYVSATALDEIEPGMRRLAEQVDRASYAAAAPAEDHAAEAWRCSDEVAAELRRQQPATRRVKMHLDPRPLRRDHATAGARPPGNRR